MIVQYNQHFREHAEGHISIDKGGARMIHLTGAASMTQEELNYYGQIMAAALQDQIEASVVEKFGTRQ